MFETVSEKLSSMFPTYLDYDGQRRAERIFQVIIVLFGFVGLLWGYAIQQYSQTVYILGAGFILAAILVLPPWPMYRLKPLPWQKPVDVDSLSSSSGAAGGGAAPASASASGSAQKSKKKK